MTIFRQAEELKLPIPEIVEVDMGLRVIVWLAKGHKQSSKSKSKILINKTSVVAQLRPLTQLSSTIKDNAKMPEIDPYVGEFVRAASPQEMGRRIRPSIFGWSGGASPQIRVFSPKSTPNLELLQMEDSYE
jgi:hypothetical protein